MSLFTRQLGGHHTLAPSVATVIANLSMIFSRQYTGALRHSQAPSCQTYSWCLQKAHSTGKSAQPSSIKSTVIVLHNRTLAWQDLSHAKSSLAVKGAWACYMPNNVLVVLTHIQLKFLYPLSTCDVTCEEMYQGLSCFFVLQAMESWAGPGNEANTFTQTQNNQVKIRGRACVYLSTHVRLIFVCFCFLHGSPLGITIFTLLSLSAEAFLIFLYDR